MDGCEAAEARRKAEEHENERKRLQKEVDDERKGLYKSNNAYSNAESHGLIKHMICDAQDKGYLVN